MPSGPGIRLDSGVYPGWTVPMEYDPLLAKLAVWGPSRDAAVRRMERALAECAVTGIKTNVQFFREILADEAFRSGALHTGFIDEFMARKPALEQDGELEDIAALAAVWHHRKQQPSTSSQSEPASRWRTTGRASQFR